MSERFFRKIHVAIAAGPLHSEPAARPDAAAGRVFNRQMDEDERIKLFMERAVSSGSVAHRAGSTAELAEVLKSVVPANSAVLVDPTVKDLVPDLGNGYTVSSLDGAGDDDLFRAAAVVTGADFAVAETGSVALADRNWRPRLASTVSAIHVALVRPGQIVADLMDLPEAFGRAFGGRVPAGVTIISGPSKTADIELNLVIGVHGPGQMHMVVVPE